jgi:expansin (peptidoglycan-binding protein)
VTPRRLIIGPVQGKNSDRQWTIPVLIAAIDPDAEAKLDGLNKALVSGSYLKENEPQGSATLPVLASSASGRPSPE